VGRELPTYVGGCHRGAARCWWRHTASALWYGSAWAEKTVTPENPQFFEFSAPFFMAAPRSAPAPVQVQSLADVSVGSLVIVEGGKAETARRGIVRFVGTTQVRSGRGPSEGRTFLTEAARVDTVQGGRLGRCGAGRARRQERWHRGRVRPSPSLGHCCPICLSLAGARASASSTLSAAPTTVCSCPLPSSCSTAPPWPPLPRPWHHPRLLLRLRRLCPPGPSPFCPCPAAPVPWARPPSPQQPRPRPLRPHSHARPVPRCPLHRRRAHGRAPVFLSPPQHAAHPHARPLQQPHLLLPPRPPLRLLQL
jgi:hypothetical protein